MSISTGVGGKIVEHINFSIRYLSNYSRFNVSYGGNNSIRWEYDQYKAKISDKSVQYQFWFLTEEQKEQYNNWLDIWIMPDVIRKYYNLTI